MIKRKCISFILIMTIVLSLCNALVSAAEAISVWDGSVASGFESGSGTESDPYIIKTAPQLAYLAQSVNGGNAYTGKYIKLANDIVLNTPDMFATDGNGNITGAASGKTPNEWTAIGGHYGEERFFKGTFDGDNHEVQGIYINKPDNSDQGLFGYCENATVKNVGVTGGYVCGNNCVGGVVGCNYAGEYSTVTIRNCYNTGTVMGEDTVGGVVGYNYANTGTVKVEDCYNTGSVSGSCEIGGVVGENYAYSGTATVEGCYNEGDVTGGSSIGGVVGSNYANKAGSIVAIRDCYNTGGVTGRGYVGGVVGYNTGYIGTSIVNGCYNTGSIRCTDYYVGGVVGYNYANNSGVATVRCCYNTGSIGHSRHFGGVVGRNEAKESGTATVIDCYNTGSISSDYYLGGIVGSNHAYASSTATIKNCYNIGGVTGRGSVGGVVGLNHAGDDGRATVENCCYLNRSIYSSNSYGTALTDIQMRQQAPYIGFDFETVWTMGGNPDYPYPKLIGMYHGGGSDAGGFASGSGTEADPYIIKTAPQLVYFAQSVNDGNTYLGKVIKLTNDIVLNTPDMFAHDENGNITGAADGKMPNEWTAIGNLEKYFCGTFDGGGHEVQGIYINKSDASYQGLFGFCQAVTIKNVGVTGGYIYGKSGLGGILGGNDEGCTVENCYNSNTIMSSDYYIGSYYVGGIAGRVSSFKEGGETATVNIINCHNAGAITGGHYVGGIVGGNYTYDGTAAIENCYNTGAVRGNYEVGGIVGSNEAAYGVSVMRYCYNVGTVDGNGGVGYVVGNNYASDDGTVKVENCYYLDGCISENNGHGTALTDSEMRQQASFVGFDFDTVWTMAGDPEYPYPELIGKNYGGDFDDPEDPENPVWDGSVASGFESGSGTEADPYIIKTAPQLAYLAQSVNNGNDYCEKFIKLANDIVLNTPDMFATDGNGNITGAASGKTPNEWTAIGSGHYDGFKYFAGVFDGDGHEIKGIYINKPDTAFQGLFGYCMAAILRNVGVTGGYICGDDYVGGVVGYNDVVHMAKVENCYNTGSINSSGYYVGGVVGEIGGDGGEVTVSNCYNTGNVIGSNCVGGVIGSNRAAGSGTKMIENCHNTGNVEGYDGNIGGVVGQNYAYDNGTVTVSNCYNTGSVNGYYFVGGVSGYNNAESSGTATVSNCYNTGSLTGYCNIGGISGYNYAFNSGIATVEECYNAGNVESDTVVGGIVGFNGAESGTATVEGCHNEGDVTGSSDYIGGVVGHNYANGGTVKVEDCYNEGSVEGRGTYVGGVVGQNNTTSDGTATVEDCHNTGSVSGSYEIGGVVGENYASSGTATVEGCYNEGGVSGSNDYVGGVVGWNAHTVTNCYNTGTVTGGDAWVGGVVGWNTNTVATSHNTGTVTGNNLVGGVVGENCEMVSNCYNTGNVTGYDNVGGVVGNNHLATVNSCDNTGSVTGVGNVGGVVGLNWTDYSEDSNMATIEDCHNEGSVDGSGSSVGGVVGCNGAANGTATIINSYNEGDVEGDGNCVGGVVGYNEMFDGEATVDGCYNTGSVSGGDYVGGVVGYNNENNPGTITVNNSYNEGSVTGSGSVGGVVGGNYTFNDIITVSGCHNTGAVTGSSSVGGVVGSGLLTLEYCYNEGDVTGDYYVGGITGCNQGTVSNSYNTGDVSGRYNGVGGVAGYNQGTVRKCYNTGAVTGSSSVGGVVGENFAEYYSTATVEASYNTGTVTGESNVGGVTGDNYAGEYGTVKAENCYNIGIVTGNTAVGGVAGDNYAAEESTAIVSNCYYLDSSLPSSNEWGNALTDAQMRQRASFYGFDFAVVWTMAGNPEYPYPELIGRNHVGDFDETEVSVWDGSVASGFESGSGTEADPYIIKTAPQLAYLAQSVNGGNKYSGKFIKLANDIVLNTPDMFARDENGTITGAADGKTPNEWTAIGNSSKYFSGTFDGDNHEVKGIYVNKPSEYEQGLFGYCQNATVKNVGVTGGYVCGNSCVGGVVGYNYAYNSGTATVENCYNTGEVTGNYYVGGVVGYNRAVSGTAMVANSYNTGAVTGNYSVGGIVGYNNAYYPGTATVENCYNAGAVTGRGNSVGGVVGYNYASSSGSTATVENSYNTGAVTGESEVGGVVGYNNASYSGSTATVANSYNTGAVTGNGYVGGVVGYNRASSSGSTATVANSYNKGAVTGNDYYVGGVVGYNNASSSGTATVVNSYNTGAVTGNGSVGGVVGYNNASSSGSTATVANSYNTGAVTGNDGYVGGVVGVNEAEYSGTAMVANSYNTGAVTGNGNCVGGVVGVNYADYSGTATVENSYNTGTVTGSSSVGGVVGYNRVYNSGTATVVNSYYLDSSISSSNEYGTALSDSEMRQRASFVGFDFATVWTMAGNPEYPYPELLMGHVGDEHTHSFSAEWVTDIEPTCTEKGIKSHHCGCGLKTDITEIDALGHDFVDGECTRCHIHRYNINIAYVYVSGIMAAEPVNEFVLEGEEYSFASPSIAGYIADVPIVSGTANANVSVVVNYLQVEPSKIVEILDIDMGKREYNTQYASLGLPNTVDAKTAAGETVSLRVTWNSEDYNPTAYGVQRISGTVTTAYGYMLDCENKVYATLEIAQNTIVSINKMSLGKLPINTPYSGLGLPEVAAVTTDRGSVYYMPVTWNTYEYDATVAGSHTIYGTVSLDEGFSFAAGVSNVAEISFELSERMYGTADIVFIIDTTGSMWDEIQNVKNNINIFAENLEASGVSVRWALLEYRDITCDGNNSTKIKYCGSSEWYIDVDAYKAALAALQVAGGGDREETVIDAIKMATFLGTREGTTRFDIVVTDADFKVNNRYGITDMSQMIEELVENETITSVVTKPTYYDIYRNLTDTTGGLLANIDGNFASELDKLRGLIEDEVVYGAVEHISIVNPPEKTEYVSGDRFDGKGMVVRAYYESGAQRGVTGYSVSPYRYLTISDKQIEINYRGKLAYANINVAQAKVPVTGISVTPEELSLEVGNVLDVSVSIMPYNASNTEFDSETTNPNVAVVDGTQITAVGAGECEIVFTSADGGFIARTAVSVIKKTPLEEIYFDEGATEMYIGDTYTVGVTYYPEDAYNKELIWNSEDSSIVSVNNGVLTALKEGSATVSATSVDGEHSAYIYVTVHKKERDIQAMASCGENVYWKLYDDGFLEIYGSGKMYNYQMLTSPWYSYRNKIKNVVISDGISSIGDFAFMNCDKMENISIPNSVDVIGVFAFFGCHALDKIELPDSVRNMGSYAFAYCSNARLLTLSQNLEKISEYNFASCSSLTSVEIPESVTSIGDYAFYDCRNLFSVLVSNSETEYGENSFAGCDKLVNRPDDETGHMIGGGEVLGAPEDAATLNSEIEVDAANSKVNVSLSTENMPKTAKVYVAAYDAFDRVKSLTLASFLGNTSEVTVEKADVSYIKIFAWNMGNLFPYTEAKFHNISD